MVLYFLYYFFLWQIKILLIILHAFFKQTLEFSFNWIIDFGKDNLSIDQ